MIRIIETQIWSNDNFQSRVCKAPSWQYVIDIFTQKEIKDIGYLTDVYNKFQGSMVARNSKVIDLKYDDETLTCGVILYDGQILRKFVQLIGVEE